MTDDEILKAVKDKEAELGDLRSRMDRSEKLYRMDAYELKDSLSNTLPEVYNLNLPDARFFADQLIGDIISADENCEVKSKDIKEKEASEVEAFKDDYMTLANQNLANLGVGGGLRSAMTSQLSLRGWSYTKSFPHVYKGKFYPGVMQWDAISSSYESDIDGLKWAACKYTRSRDKILAEYPDAVCKNDSAEVLDVLTKDTNFIFVDNQPARAPLRHNFLVVPVIIEFNPMSAYLRTEGYMQYEGDDIFSSVRDLYDHLFRLASVLETRLMRSFLNNHTLTGNDENSFPDPNIQPPPSGERGIIPLKKGERLDNLTLGDIKNEIVYYIQLIETRLQRGTLPNTEYGQGFSGASGVGIKALGEQRNARYIPIMQSMGRALSRLYRLIINQWAIGGFSHDDITAPKDSVLSKKFTVDVDISFISPVESVANYMIAKDQMALGMPLEYVLTNTIHDPNPHKTMLDIYAYRAQFLTSQSPPLEIWRCAKALKEQKKEIEAGFTLGLLGMGIEALDAKDFASLQQPPKPSNGANQGEGDSLSLSDLTNRNKVAPGMLSSNEEAAQMSKQMGVQSG